MANKNIFKAMIEYAKIILPKVSFSEELFRKELNKCIHWVEPDQVQKLYLWCFENFNEMYPDVLNEVFKGTAVHKYDKAELIPAFFTLFVLFFLDILKF